MRDEQTRQTTCPGGESDCAASESDLEYNPRRLGKSSLAARGIVHCVSPLWAASLESGPEGPTAPRGLAGTRLRARPGIAPHRQTEVLAERQKRPRRHEKLCQEASYGSKEIMYRRAAHVLPGNQLAAAAALSWTATAAPSPSSTTTSWSVLELTATCSSCSVLATAAPRTSPSGRPRRLRPLRGPDEEVGAALDRTREHRVRRLPAAGVRETALESRR